MSGSVKNMGTDLVKSKTLLNIVLPNSLSPNSVYIFFTAHKAGFLRRFHFGGFGLFGDIRRRLALFVFVHNSNFRSQMPNSHKNLQLAVNNSTRTASVKTAKSAAKQSIFRVSIRTIGRWSDDYNQVLIYRTTTKPHPKRRQSVWLANTSSRFFRYTPLWRVKSSVHS